MDLTPQNEFECVHLDITDELLSNAKIIAYMCDQQLNTPEGQLQPYEPKKFPEKAVVVVLPVDDSQFEIFFDTNEKKWDSAFVANGKFGKLSPDQFEQFFKTGFFKNLVETLHKRWPDSDPFYAELLEGLDNKEMRIGMRDVDIERFNECESRIDEVNQANKRKDLANQDTTGDGKRDYSGSGRKIIHFGDMGVVSKSGLYFCWPRHGKEFKWNSWKDWTKIRPFARMTFVHSGREYMISLSLFDEEFDNRGFRGADLTWTPPLAWLTPEECKEVMNLTMVQKFLRQCMHKVHTYLSLSPQEVYERIDKPERVTIKEIEKTQRVIRHVVNIVFKKHQADNYRFDK